MTSFVRSGSKNVLALAVALMLVVLAAALGRAESAWAQTPVARDGEPAGPIRIEGPRVALTFDRPGRDGSGRDRAGRGGGGGGGPRVRLRSIESADRAFVFDTSRSPLFRVVLFDRREGTAGNTMQIEGPTPGNDTLVPPSGIRLERDGPSAADIELRGIPVPGTRHRLAIRIRVDANGESGGAEWSAAAELDGPGTWVIGALELPVLRLAPVGEAEDDAALLPLTGGLLLPHPSAAPPPPRGVVRDPFGTVGNFHYPGYVESQFLGYLDGAHAGLYVAAEDPAGYTKALQVEPEPDRGLTELRLHHVNLAPDPARTARTDPTRELRTISVGRDGKLPYPIVTDVVRGDWRDLADRYRAWLERARPPFLAKGPLAEREDVPRAVAEAAFGLALTFVEGEHALRDRDDVEDPDAATLEAIHRFFHDREGRPLGSSMTLLGDVAGRRGRGNANDARVNPVRPGLVEWLGRVRASEWGRRIATVNMNRDIGNWTFAGAENARAMLRRGIVIASDGTPARRGGPDREGIRGITANGSRYALAHRLDQFRRTLERTRTPEGNAIDSYILSGRGSSAHVCFAPMFLEGGDLDAHHHSIGGGTYFVDGYRSLVSEIRSRFGAELPRFLPGGERSHEHLVDTSILAGRLRLAPIDDTVHGADTWLEGGEPVPLLEWLYHDHALLGARLNRRSDVISAYARAHFGASDAGAISRLLAREDFLTLERLRFARATLLGRRIGFYVEAPGRPWSEVPDVRRVDGPPGVVPPPLERNFEFLRETTRLRAEAAPWLVYGRMLRPPRVEIAEPEVDLPVLRAGRLERVREPRVLATAWRAPDGRIAITLAKPAAGKATIRIRLAPGDHGLPQPPSDGSRDRPEGGPKLRDPIGGITTALGRGSGGSWQSERIVIDDSRPTRLWVIESE